MKIEELLSLIANRPAGLSGGWIGTAGSYVKSLSRPDDVDPAVWQKALADADSRLIFDAPHLEIIEKSFNEGTGIGSDCCLEYDAVLTTVHKDRDGDIVRPAGLEIDVKMPLLWQHDQTRPIGKHVKVLEQSDQRVVCKFGICDIPLGRDAAKLAKFGAQRKSHGFVPMPGEFEPLEIVKGADGKDYAKGWDIKKAKCFEGSLVSIPANANTGILQCYEKEFDAICTAVSRGVLETPMVKAWAQGLYEKRRVSVPVGIDLQLKVNGQELWLPGMAGGVKAAAAVDATPPAGQAAKSVAQPNLIPNMEMETPDGKCSECGCMYDTTGTCTGCGHVKGGDKKTLLQSLSVKGGIAELQTKMLGMDPYLEGSFQWINYKLRQTVQSYLESKGVSGIRHGYADVEATFADQALVCVYSYDSNEYPCYRLSWEMSEGKPQWTGDPQAVEVKTQVVEKLLAELQAKSAAVMKTKAGKALAAKSATPAGQHQIDRPTIDVLVRKLITTALATADQQVALKALQSVAEVAADIQREVADREIEALFSLN